MIKKSWEWVKNYMALFELANCDYYIELVRTQLF